uniref:Uncharacterized protein n=1 Tax=Piliocolobus tephrosceles TaxID=591936 RepID=A0A8C9GM39_9PRIM
ELMGGGVCIHRHLVTDVSLKEASVLEPVGNSTALRGGLDLAECSSHKGSSQRMPYQPSAPRLPKVGQVWEESYIGQLLGWSRDLSHH